MATHAFPQLVQSAKLELLDGSFRAVQGGRHLADTLLLDEAHLDDLPLRVGQPFDFPIERYPPLDVLVFARIGNVGWRLAAS